MNTHSCFTSGRRLFAPGAAARPPAFVASRGRQPAREIATRELCSEWSISKPGQAPPPPTGTINVARNSLATTSNFEVTLSELQRFQRLLKLHPNELRARFWKTVPQVIQQVTRRHERPRPPAARPHQCRT